MRALRTLPITEHRGATRQGFSLIEMLIVVTLVAIVTAMVMPKVNYVAYRVDVGARSFRAALQRAQAYAVSSQHNMLVAVDAANARARGRGPRSRPARSPRRP